MASSSTDADAPTASAEPDPYRELFERSADAILIIEGETFVDCNRATVEMLRYENREELLSTHPSELSPPTQPDGRDSYEKANEMIAIAFADGSHRFEWDHKRADGTVIPVEVLLTAVRRGEKRILHVVWRDITERKQLEEHLRQAQKMEAIGQLVGGIAHDFNNFLVSIIGNSEFLHLKLEGRPDLQGIVGEIRIAGDRAAALIRQLLAFSRKSDVLLRVVDLNGVLRDTHKLLRHLIGEDVQLLTVPADDPVRVKVDPVQIEQVLINLATNARDAMPEGGVLTIEVQCTVIGARADGVRGDIEPGVYALICVSDTGVGMDEETARRVFDPFFTTKEVGRGTGLGLATVYGVAKQCGGTVVVHSTLGQGTTMKVYLPITLEQVVGGLDGETLPTEGGNETILVVEDERSVSSLVVRVLRGKGYRVLLANDGREALALWERHGGTIDLILTDVVMPHLGGLATVSTLRARGEKPRVLFMSGYTDDALAALRGMDEEIDLLDKPFSVAELAGRVRLALDRE